MWLLQIMVRARQEMPVCYTLKTYTYTICQLSPNWPEKFVNKHTLLKMERLTKYEFRFKIENWHLWSGIIFVPTPFISSAVSSPHIVLLSFPVLGLIIIIIIIITSIYGAIHQIDTMALTRPKTWNTFKRLSHWLLGHHGRHGVSRDIFTNK